MERPKRQKKLILKNVQKVNLKFKRNHFKERIKETRTCEFEVQHKPF